MRFGLFLTIFVAAAAVGSGCDSNIGDGCSDSTDCSTGGARLCDNNQPGGYCTIPNCDPDTCPGGSACVEWRFDLGRTAATWCMAECAGGGCRGGYECLADEDIVSVNPGPDGGVTQLARIIDLEPDAPDTSICVADILME